MHRCPIHLGSWNKSVYFQTGRNIGGGRRLKSRGIQREGEREREIQERKVGKDERWGRRSNDVGVYTNMGGGRRVHSHRRHFSRRRTHPPLRRQEVEEDAPETPLRSLTKS